MAELNPSFPMVFVTPIVDELRKYFNTGYVIEPRTLGSMEATDAIGVFPASWVPIENSKFIGQHEPTQSQYRIRVQNLHINADDVDGRARFSADARKIRAILYRSTTLQVAFASLQEVLLGSVERFQKYDVVRQEFLNSRQLDGFIYLCTTEVAIWTETTQGV